MTTTRFESPQPCHAHSRAGGAHIGRVVSPRPNRGMTRRRTALEIRARVRAHQRRCRRRQGLEPISRGVPFYVDGVEVGRVLAGWVNHRRLGGAELRGWLSTAATLLGITEEPI